MNMATDTKYIVVIICLTSLLEIKRKRERIYREHQNERKKEGMRGRLKLSII